MERIRNCKSLSEAAIILYGVNNTSNREKVKVFLLENNISYKEWLDSKKRKVYCLQCGKEIISKYNYRQKFCSRSCSAIYSNKKNRNVRFCLNCGKELISSQEKFCCSECQHTFEYNDYIEKWKKGEEKGLTIRNRITKPIRRYLFEKYNNSCQICGWNKIHPLTGLVPLQIHHIDGDCTNNSEDNLQLLCPNCHSLTENYGNLNSNSKRFYYNSDKRKVILEKK